MINQIISGNSFANFCDHIYSQTIKDEKSRYRITVNEEVIGLIESNQSIFVKTDYIKQFFDKIRRRTDIRNIKVITHDSDIEIDKNILDIIPVSVSKMFSINVNVEDSRIVPIPIGIANSYCDITFKPDSKRDLTISGIKALIACNVKNNIRERLPLYTHSFDNEVTVIKNQLSLKNYEDVISQHDFIFCPEGNGLDTHRVWETLYLGKIPIVKKSLWNKNFRDLPVMFVENLLNANNHERMIFVQKILNSSINTEKLELSYWINEIKS